jgi:peptidoglycan/LPS O-acetylase OafA/YrhL
MVALMHAANLMRVEHLSGHVGLGNAFGFGYVGVDFFFVLSGFIIDHVNSAELGRAANMPRYLWHRFSRIYPIYWIILLLTAVVYGTGVAVGLGCIMLIGRYVELPLVQLLKDRRTPRPARSLLGVA